MKKCNLTSFLLVFLSAVAATLNALPNAVKLNFAASPEEIITSYFSGYSLVPVGYAVWGAMAAGIGAIALTLLGIAGAVKWNAELRKWMLWIAVVSVVMSMTTLLFGAMTAIGGVITVLLAVEAVLLYFRKE